MNPQFPQYSPYQSHDGSVALYNACYGALLPYEYNGWKPEVMSWKQGCYLHAGLNPSGAYRLSGPDAMRLLSDTCTNSFTSFPIDSVKHAIMCNDAGHIMAHGVLIRTGEAEFESFFLSPWLDYFVDSGKYDVRGEDLRDKIFLFQVAGPRSLEVLEAATRQDLHDLRFLRCKASAVPVANGRSVAVRVARVGMAGTLAYEVHGAIEDAPAVYDAILKAGQPFGIERLGMMTYGMNHTENGFPQVHIHFLSAWPEETGFQDYLGPVWQFVKVFFEDLKGSAGDDLTKRYMTPIALGWGNVVKFDHDFIGRAALEREAADPKRTVVTLEWHADDVLDVYASYLRDGPEHPFMDFTANPIWNRVGMGSHVDDVMVDGRAVGVSMGRIYSYHYRRMLSLCTIDLAASAIGTEVEVIWGEPGTHQKRIRATVARYPYLDLPRNERIDVSDIPRLGS